MNGIEGLVYLLNQAGVALAEANQRIASLTDENQALRGSLVETKQPMRWRAPQNHLRRLARFLGLPTAGPPISTGPRVGDERPSVPEIHHLE
jgi:hypothetical protein